MSDTPARHSADDLQETVDVLMAVFAATPQAQALAMVDRPAWEALNRYREENPEKLIPLPAFRGLA